MRPLYYDFSLSDSFVAQATATNDPLVVHQFMFGACPSNDINISSVGPYATLSQGPRLLVAPVGTPNTLVKEVYLPRLPDATAGLNVSWKHW